MQFNTPYGVADDQSASYLCGLEEGLAIGAITGGVGKVVGGDVDIKMSLLEGQGLYYAGTVPFEYAETPLANGELTDTKTNGYYYYWTVPQIAKAIYDAISSKTNIITSYESWCSYLSDTLYYGAKICYGGKNLIIFSSKTYTKSRVDSICTDYTDANNPAKWSIGAKENSSGVYTFGMADADVNFEYNTTRFINLNYSNGVLSLKHLSFSYLGNNTLGIFTSYTPSTSSSYNAYLMTLSIAGCPMSVYIIESLSGGLILYNSSSPYFSALLKNGIETFGVINSYSTLFPLVSTHKTAKNKAIATLGLYDKGDDYLECMGVTKPINKSTTYMIQLDDIKPFALLSADNSANLCLIPLLIKRYGTDESIVMMQLYGTSNNNFGICIS